jgi:hypothetical protein
MSNEDHHNRGAVPVYHWCADIFSDQKAQEIEVTLEW